MTAAGVEPVVATSVMAPVTMTISRITVATTVSAPIVDIQPVIPELPEEENGFITEIHNGTSSVEMVTRKRELLADGYTLEITKANYNNSVLQSIEGTIADSENKSRFVADDFSKIVISKIQYKDGKSAFNIRIHNNTIRL